MSLTERMAVKIGKNAKLFLNVDDNKEEIIVYGAINLFQIIFAVLWIIIFGLFFGVLYEALIFSFSVNMLRKYSGGGHASSSIRCRIISTSIAVLAGIAIDKLFYKLNMTTVILISIALMGFALIIVAKNAPIDSIKKPISNIQIKKRFKKKSIIVILIFLFIIIILYVLCKKYSELYYIKVIESISLGILWQTSTLTKNGIRLLNKGDFVLKYIVERG